MLKFLRSNLKHTFNNQRGLALLLVIVQIFSVLVIVFSYGVINHYNVKVNEKESTTLIYDFVTKEDEEGYGYWVSKDKLDKFMEKILPFIEDKLDYFFIMGSLNEYYFKCSSGFENGRYTVSEQIKKRLELDEDEKFTDEQMNSSEKIIIVGDEFNIEDGYVTIDNVKYKVIGTTEIFGAIDAMVPYNVIPDNTKVWYISILLKMPLWESEYNHIAELMTEAFGDTFVIPEFEGVENESDNKVYRDIMFVVGFIIFVCAVNYCIMYRYMLEKRRREFAITRICGCSRVNAGLVSMIELLGTSIATLVVGELLFHFLVLPAAKEYFYYIGMFYSSEVYVTISAIYIGLLCLTYLILICRFVRKTPVSLIKEV